MPSVLLVEDHHADIALTKKAFALLYPDIDLFVTIDGIEAMQFLRQEGKFAGAVRPDLILLDLNMPRKSGREVLSDLAQLPVLRQIPVIILTTSSAEQDVLTAYQLCANSYVVKPVGFEAFKAIIESIVSFWFHTATLPG